MNEVNDANPASETSGVERLVMGLREAIAKQQTVFCDDRIVKQLLIDSADAIERMHTALKDVAHPIGKWQRELKDDERLDGAMAIYMLKDPETYRRIARDALAP
jgi:hypothetical protein